MDKDFFDGLEDFDNATVKEFLTRCLCSFEFGEYAFVDVERVADYYVSRLADLQKEYDMLSKMTLADYETQIVSMQKRFKNVWLSDINDTQSKVDFYEYLLSGVQAWNPLDDRLIQVKDFAVESLTEELCNERRHLTELKDCYESFSLVSLSEKLDRIKTSIDELKQERDAELKKVKDSAELADIFESSFRG